MASRKRAASAVADEPRTKDGEEHQAPATREGSHKRYRVFAIEIAARERAADAPDGSPALYDITFSSETPVLRRGWFGNWTEVLGHSAGEVDTSYLDLGVSVLVDHRGDLVGTLREGRIEGGKGRGAIQFSRNPRGQEIERDVLDGVRKFISVGYMVDSELLVERNEEKGDTYRVTRWTPLEVSVVSVPADVTVGFGRSATDVVNPIAQDGDAVREERTMPEDKKVETPATGGGTATIDVGAERKAAASEERQRQSFARELGKRLGVEDKIVEELLGGEMDQRAIGQELLKRSATNGQPLRPAADALADMPEKDQKRWSLLRAIRIGACMSAAERGDSTDDFGREKFDGAEKEVHDRLRSAQPKDIVGHGGIMVPMAMPTSRELAHAIFQRLMTRAGNGDEMAMMAVRTLNAGAIGKGPEAVFEAAGSFIELLRAQSVVIASGAQVMPDLVGPISFPKQSAAATPYSVGENPAADVADSDISLGAVQMAQKTLQASTGYTRQLLGQSSIGVEALVRNDFNAIHSLAYDNLSVHGTGNSGEPMGIYKTPGVGSVAMGGAPTFAKLIDMQTAVANANAAQGRLGLITTPTVAGTARKTVEFATAGSKAIWTGTFYEGEVGGFPARASTNMSSTMSGTDDTGGSSHCGVFGNWADLLIGFWGGLEMVVDIYRLKKRAIIEVTSFQMFDCAPRHAESFCVGTGLTG